MAQKTKLTREQKFLVVSYDDDQQQWFWDYVMAADEEAPEAKVCECRPYVIAADAATLKQVRGIAGALRSRSPKKIRDQFHWDTYSDDVPSHADDKGSKPA